MCGIIGIFGIKSKHEKYRARALKMASKLRHRGPDYRKVYSDNKTVLVHERLSIVDIEHGAQPLVDKLTGRVLIANGEIYDHEKLKGKLEKEHLWQTKSDCEVLLYLYDEYGIDFLSMLDGIFAFVIYDEKKGDFFIARDHIGIVPLYVGWDKEGQFYVASEMKALIGHCTKIKEFPPGCYYLGKEKKFIRWYKPQWKEKIPSKKLSLDVLRKKLEDSVKKQMMSDAPYGLLISGGLDSSIIAAIVSREKDKLHSFSIGLKDSPDLKYAKKVADYLGTKHHEIVFSVQEGLDSLRDVIYHLETFDVTSIRAATPMYLMSRKIKSLGIKMVFSGEGSDETFGGYLYFHKAPDAEEFHKETVRKLFMLSKYDCLRANKATAAWGVEARVPFLSKDFLDYAMSIKPEEKMCGKDKIEKYILRKAFEEYLPKEIVWRQKEQFSDGVGYGWIGFLRKYTDKVITDKMMSEAEKRFPVQPPKTKEEYYYRTIFDELFPGESAALTVPVGPTIACSTSTAFRWSESFKDSPDPSGRSVKEIHKSDIKISDLEETGIREKRFLLKGGLIGPVA